MLGEHIDAAKGAFAKVLEYSYLKQTKKVKNSRNSYYNKKIHLKKHQHSSVQYFSFYCKICDFTHYKKIHLKRHKEARHLRFQKEWSHSCDKRKFKSPNKDILKKHKLNQRTFLCDFNIRYECKKWTTKSKHYLRSHVEEEKYDAFDDLLEKPELGHDDTYC